MISSESDNGISNNNEMSEYIKLFIGQVPRDIDEGTLQEYFEEFGPVIEVTIIRDQTTFVSKGNLYYNTTIINNSWLPRIFVLGCAFVTYVNNQSAMEAINKLHDKVKLPNVSIVSILFF